MLQPKQTFNMKDEGIVLNLLYAANSYLYIKRCPAGFLE